MSAMHALQPHVNAICRKRKEKKKKKKKKSLSISGSFRLVVDPCSRQRLQGRI